MSLDPGGLVDQETVHAHDPSVEDIDPKTRKEIAGKSPTQIALSRLRKDRVAVVCTIILFLLVVIAIIGPFLVKQAGLYWDIKDPNAPRTTEVLEFDGYPAIGQPVPPLHLGPPARHRAERGYDNLATDAPGPAHLAADRDGGHGHQHHRRCRGRAARRLLARLAGPGHLVRHRRVPVLPVPPRRARPWRRSSVDRFGQDADTLQSAQLYALIAILVIFGWMGLARLIRGQVLSLREREFVLAAKVIGVADPADPVQGAAAQPGGTDRDRRSRWRCRPTSPRRRACRSSASA